MRQPQPLSRRSAAPSGAPWAARLGRRRLQHTSLAVADSSRPPAPARSPTAPNRGPTVSSPPHTHTHTRTFPPAVDSLTQLTEYTKDLSKACQDSLLDLAGCASDNDAFADPPSTITSLSTSNGCCLTDCSNNIKKAIAQGCFNDLLKVICKDPKASKYKTGL